LQLSPKPGSTARVVLTGFNRPTSVAETPDGILYICDEFGGKIYRATEFGTPTVLTANLTLPDDVIINAEGHLLVNALQGTVWDIDPQTGRASPLVVGLSAPHGIALDTNGDVIIADATLNRIYRLTLPTVAIL
jgi:sugar lactone lactonase YvrE